MTAQPFTPKQLDNLVVERRRRRVADAEVERAFALDEAMRAKAEQLAATLGVRLDEERTEREADAAAVTAAEAEAQRVHAIHERVRADWPDA
jgi:hypothetical protein